jgi:hypothetical protein
MAGIWQFVGMQLGSYIDNKYLFPTKVEGTRLQDLKVQTSTYGVAIPHVYAGMARVAGNIVWGTKFVEHKKTSKQGGKGGGGGAEVTEYSYSVSFAVGLSKGPIAGIRRVWADGKPFPLYESKYSLNGITSDHSGGLGQILAGLIRGAQKLQFSEVDSLTATKWLLTAKNVDDAQVLGVEDEDGNEYDDAYFGSYYNNGQVSFTVNKTTESTIIVDGRKFILSVEPHTAKYEFTIHTGSETQMPDSFIESIEGTGNVPAYRGMAYVVFRNLYVDDFGRRIPSLTFELESTIHSLSATITTICDESGLTSEKIITTDLTGISVTGFSTERAGTGADKIKALQTVYNFDAVEQNGKVVFQRRSTVDAIEIPYDDLGACENNEKTEPLQKIRMPEMDLPRKLSVRYFARNFDYQEQTASSKRQLTTSKVETTIDTGLVLTDSEAQELADKLLYEAWLNRVSYNFVVGSKYATILPGKVLKVADNKGDIHTMVTTKTAYGKPGLNKISAMAIDGIVYKTAARDVDPNGGSGTDKPQTQVYFEFLDLPKLPGDSSSTDSIYFAATGEVYSGVNIFRTADNGATYELVQQYAFNSTMGYTITKLEAGVDHCWDNKNTVDVVVISGTLESRPLIDVLNGFNAAVIGNEIIQFRTATLISTGTYRLSGLLRGRLGTEDHITTHTADDRFVLLTAETLGRIPSNQEDWYTPRQYRIGPVTAAVDDLTYMDVEFINTARMNRSWAVSHVTGVRDAAGNLTVVWMRRTRLNGEWKDLSDVPLNETAEKYEIDIMTGSAVLKTVTITEPVWNYTTAEQTTDFGSVQPSITIRIYQISESRGRGIAKEETV